MRGINLSRYPFVNRRPVVRLAVLLWAVAVGLIAVNLSLYMGYWHDSREIRGQLAQANDDLDLELTELERKDDEVRNIRLGAQNRQALFLNSLIAFRTFPWSALFDDLEGVTPMGVRLLSVTPEVRLASIEAMERLERRQSRRASRSTSRSSTPDPSMTEDEVTLRIEGIAKTEDDVIQFVDTLYADEDFRRPFLSREARRDNNTAFSISVIYRTADPSPSAAEADGTLVADSATAPDGASIPDGATALDDEASPDAASTGSVENAETDAVADGAVAAGFGEVTGADDEDDGFRRPESDEPAPSTRALPSRQVSEEVAAARRSSAPSGGAPIGRAGVPEEDEGTSAGATPPNSGRVSQGEAAARRIQTAADARRKRLEELRRRNQERRQGTPPRSIKPAASSIPEGGGGMP